MEMIQNSQSVKERAEKAFARTVRPNGGHSKDLRKGIRPFHQGGIDTFARIESYSLK